MSSGNNEAKADAIAPAKPESPAKTGGWALLTRTRKLAFVVLGSVLGVTSAVVGTKYFTASPGSVSWRYTEYNPKIQHSDPRGPQFA